MEEIIAFIDEIAQKNGYVDRSLSPDDKLKDDLGLDSLGILTIIDEIEEKFEISLEPEEMQQNPQTVKDLAIIIQGKRNE